MAHFLADGRGSLQAIDLFFKNLRSEVLSADVSVNHLPWGEEITRVSPPTIDAIAGLTGPRSVDDNTLPAEPIKQKEITFERPTHSVASWEERPSPFSDIRLTRAETATFHHICRKRKANSTAVLNGIYILADIETVLYCARRNRKECPSDYDRALEAYGSADVYVVNENMADRRSLLSRTIPSVSSPGGFGNNVCEVFQTKHSMRHIRGCLSVEYDGTCRINLQSPHFWSGMVAETEAQMTAMKKTTPDRFVEAERQAEILSVAFNAEEYFKPGVLLTSIGRLSSLKLFDDFLPTPTSSSPFLILDIALGISASGPDVKPVALMTWEYDDKLNIHLCGSAKWHDEDEWSFLEKCVRTSLNQLLKSAATKL